MSRLRERLNKKIQNSKSILAFETSGDGSLEKWDRYLTIEGNRAYHIGNVCGTCRFFFERMEGANQSLSPSMITTELEQGLLSLDANLLENIAEIIPNGQYIVSLIDVYPKLIEIGSDYDYFVNEQIDCWGEDGFWGFPHHPKIRYYRGNDQIIEDTKLLYEFIIPMFPQNWLDNETVEKYQKMFSEDRKPTAVTLSVLDIKEFYDCEQSHYCLAHYILDGHHKMYAASLENKPISILAFVAVEQGVSSKEDIEYLLRNI